MIIGIVAISKNSAIGKDGKLPWHYSADLKFFKETTTGHIVVMGSNTWRSIGRPLPNRLNVVLTRRGISIDDDSVRVVNSKREVIELADGERDVFIIGGAATYREFADEIEKWIVTDVPPVVEDADTFMPGDFLNGFELERSVELGDDLNVRVLHRK